MFLYIKEGRSFGPVSGAELLELLETGVLAPDDLARLQGERDWMPVYKAARGVLSGRYPSQPPPAGGSRASVPAGAHTVFTSAPPAPPPPTTVSFPTADAAGCVHCGTAAAPDASFCKRCGASLGRLRCIGCGRGNDEDAAFCAGCGRRLGGD